MSRHAGIKGSLQRKIINTYWIVFGLSLLAECIALFLKIKNEPGRVHEYLTHTVLFPTLIQLLVLGANELASRLRFDRPLLIILSGTVIASSLIIANKTIHLQYIFLLSMLVSMFYFKIKYLYFAFIINMVAFASVYFTFAQVRHGIGMYELSAFIFVMIGMVFILRGIIQRGEEILKDIKRIVRNEEELLVRNVMMDRMVKMDALTDLYNHKTLHEYLDQLVDQSNNCSMSMQLAVIDIDNFKAVNDTYGHAVGDVILVRVANMLKESITPNEIVARYGGEEFVVIFTGKTLAESFDEIDKARENIWRQRHEEMDGRQISVSIGLADHRIGWSRSELFEKADALLYEAKRGGKNRTVLESPSVAEVTV